MAIRVLHVIESLVPEAGSVGALLPGLFAALRANDVQSEVVVAAGDTVGDIRIPVHAGAASEIDALLDRHDVIHIHGWGNDLARLVAASACKAEKPYVLSPHGSLCEGPHSARTWTKRLRGLFRDNRLIRDAAGIVALNDAEAHDLRDRGGHANVMVLPYGLTFADYETLDEEGADLPDRREGRCLLLLGPIAPIEGLVPLLKSFAEIGRDSDGWHVVLAGREESHWRKSIEAAIRRKGAVDRVVVASARDVKTQRAWLGRASVLAGVGLQVGPPGSILQALATGVPVLASDRVAPPAVDGAVRVCAPVRSQLKEALRSMLTVPCEELTARGVRARATAAALFDWPVLVDRYVRLYKGLR